MRLLRTISFDASDARVFDLAAEPGEVAVPGGFDFAGLARDEIAGKLRQAFANGFLGLASLGRSTFAVAAEVDEEDAERAALRLAGHLRDRHGAPDIEAALAAAHEEIAFARELAEGIPLNTVLTLRRTFGDDGRIREEFRTINPPGDGPPHARIWTITDDPT